MAAAIAAYLHFLAIFFLFALLVLQHHTFRLPLGLEQARSLTRLDIAYGLSAGLVLASGLARTFWYGKGWEYYLHNGLFHAKFGLFILIALLSILPTVVFLRWRPALKENRPPAISARMARLLTWSIRLELLLLLCMPLLATLLARGFGVNTG
ncbi:DUF2214 family protein [Neisseriaceae bacterium TC5R-5]|nr:DUF2214 family protein [Neisseriaceae bacterium TC5R-5]